jgi:hypothetical protein
MRYIASVKTKKIDSVNKISIVTTQIQLVDADTEASALSKINNYYQSAASGSVSYNITVQYINSVIT